MLANKVVSLMNPNYLDFEQPIAELEAKIEELRLVGSDNERH
jgi:acetyl-CoA carboxylase carboxyl transferase subunit alpha